MRLKAKVDKNQPVIVEVLRKRGFQVICMHAVGRGFPDLIVAKNRDSWLVEIKDGNERLTDRQTVFHSEWQGKPIQILRSLDDALRFPL